MSSLINSASVWDSGDAPKKRVSTMRKTIKKKYSEPALNVEENLQKEVPSTIEELQNYSNERTDRVNNLRSNSTS